MPYNPGITARGETLGLSIGAAGQSIAQQYGEGLKLQEEQKRYNKEQKRLKKARRFIEDSNIKRAGILAEQIFDDEGTVTAFKETIEGWEAADVAGWLAGQTDSMKMQAQQGTIALQSLQLKELESEMAQDPVMRQAMADMTMYQTEQNLSPMDALNSTVQQNPDLSQDSRFKLNELVQKRQTMAYNVQSLQLKGLASETDRINAETNAGNARLNQQIFNEGQARRAKGAQVHAIPGVEGSTVVEFPSGSGTRSQVVQTGVETPLDPVQEMEKKTLSDTVDKKVATAYAEADQIARGGGEELKEVKGGDERTGWGVSRYDRLAGQWTELEKASSDYKAKTGKEHPQLKSFYDRVGSLVMHMREQGRTIKDVNRIMQSIGLKRKLNQLMSEGRDKEANELALKFGIDLTQ